MLKFLIFLSFLIFVNSKSVKEINEKINLKSTESSRDYNDEDFELLPTLRSTTIGFFPLPDNLSIHAFHKELNPPIRAVNEIFSEFVNELFEFI